MKLQSRAFDGLLRNPDKIRGILLFGDDAGLVRERGRGVVKAVAGSLDDPFRVVTLGPTDAKELVGEFQSMAMTGGRRVVWVSDAGDALAGPARAALATKSDAMMVLEAGELTPRSKLRAMFEAASDLAALGCYTESGADLAGTITQTLKQEGLTATREALAYLCAHLGNDRGVTRSDLQRLAIYVAPEKQVTLDHAIAITGDMTNLAVDDAVFFATAGQVELADHGIDRAFADGATAVGILRRLLSHLQRLQQLRNVMDETGVGAAEAVRSARPPIFFSYQPLVVKALTRLRADALAAAAHAVWEAEFQCKQTGTPDMWLCKTVLADLSRDRLAN